MAVRHGYRGVIVIWTACAGERDAVQGAEVCRERFLQRVREQFSSTAIMSSTGSCQVLCVSLDTAMVLRVITPHDLEGPEASSHARHERELLSREDEKDQKW